MCPALRKAAIILGSGLVPVLVLVAGVIESGPHIRSSYHAAEQFAEYVDEEHVNVRPTLASG